MDFDVAIAFLVHLREHILPVLPPGLLLMLLISLFCVIFRLLFLSVLLGDTRQRRFGWL